LSRRESDDFGLPHFGLAKAERLDPKIFVKSEDDQLGSFMLALAVVYNDIKSLVWFDQLLLDHEPNKSTPIEKDGQWHGLQEILTKYILGVLHELFKLIKENQDQVSSEEMAEVVKSLRPNVRRKWNTLVTISIDSSKSETGRFAKSLARVRNNISFHYYDPTTLIKGYLAHFSEDSEDEKRRFAFMSYGKNMAETRFYYADAAVERALELILIEYDAEKATKHTLEDVNQALSGLILRFSEMRNVDSNSG